MRSTPAKAAKEKRVEVPALSAADRKALEGAIKRADGTPVKIDTDYFGKPRDPANPGAGPFAGLKPGKHEIKVWPKGNQQK